MSFNGLSRTKAIILFDLNEDCFNVHATAIQKLPCSQAELEVTARSDGHELVFLLATAIKWSGDTFTDVDLAKIETRFSAADDVWSSGFLAFIVFQASQTLAVRLKTNIPYLIIDPATSVLSDGPYVINVRSRDVHRVSKLFDDRYQAFIGGSVRYNPSFNGFEWLGIEERIAVPSRLYYKPTSPKSLAGVRFAVKDIVDVAGLETGCGNRCYRRQYPKKSVSAPCVQQLVDAGAILVGKTKTTQFAQGQVPLQWVDYLCPFNPRGDMYQKPSSSSTGSAVASAAYSWLDFTIATDTGGSIRHPAGVCGIYGFRPSLNAVSSKGSYSVAPLLDTIGICARSAPMLDLAFRNLADLSYLFLPSPKSTTKYKLLYPMRGKGTTFENSRRWFPYHGEGTGNETLFENFISRLERHLGCPRTALNIDDLWRETRPAGQSGSLDEATGSIYTALTSYTCIRQTVDQFITDYKTTHYGHMPFIDPIVKARQDHGRQITDTQFVNAVSSAKLFSKWVHEVLYATSQADELPLLVFPQSWGLPNYRDTCGPNDQQIFWSAFSPYSLSYLSGCPDCTVPIAELPYHSRITDCEASLPISVSILSKPGADLILLALLIDLEEKGIVQPVNAGTRMYS